jgi:uncharacterized protein YndB with AHSA1/START domain
MTLHGTGTGGALLASLRAVDGKAIVHVEDRFSTDIDDLWSAITDPQRLVRWIAEVDGDLRLGGEFHAHFTSSWEGPGRVDVCDPPRRLLVTLEPGQAEQTVIEARLVPDGDHTRLIVENRGLPLDVAPSHGAGWQVHIEDLAAYLAGRAPGDWKTRWIELRPAYYDQQSLMP